MEQHNKKDAKELFDVFLLKADEIKVAQYLTDDLHDGPGCKEKREEGERILLAAGVPRKIDRS